MLCAIAIENAYLLAIVAYFAIINHSLAYFFVNSILN